MAKASDVNFAPKVRTPQALPDIKMPEVDISNPYSVLDGQLTTLQLQARSQVEKLQAMNLDPKVYNQYIGKLQASYNQSKAQLMQTGQQFGWIAKGMQDGLINPADGRKAMLSMVLPQETMQAMFPKPQPQARPDRPLSPGQRESYYKTVEEYAASAPFTRERRKGPNKYKTQADLVTQYNKWRADNGYDNLPPVQQRQLDAEWDTAMRSNKRYDWDPKSAEVKSLRTYGNRTMRAAARNVSPFARSVMGPTQRTGAPQTEDPLGIR